MIFELRGSSQKKKTRSNSDEETKKRNFSADRGSFSIFFFFKSLDKKEKMEDFEDFKMLTRSERINTLGSIGLAQALDSADKALLPSVLKALEKDLEIR